MGKAPSGNASSHITNVLHRKQAARLKPHPLLCCNLVLPVERSTVLRGFQGNKAISSVQIGSGVLMLACKQGRHPSRGSTCTCTSF